MVARNRYEGGNPPGGRDDLPPRLRDRLRSRLTPADTAVGHRTGRPVSPGWLRGVGRLALLFLCVAVANVLVLLLALWILQFGATNPALPVLDPLPAR
jgi:hypothetical protein